MEHVRGNRGAKLRALAEWRRMLEEAEQNPTPTGDASPLQTPVAGQNPVVAAEDAKVTTQAKHREADAFEADLSTKGAKQRRFAAVDADIESDGEARAGMYLRLQGKGLPNPQPTQNLMSTLASQRKVEVRQRRRVNHKHGAKTKSGFDHLPHQGLWKAQPLDKPQVQSRKPPAYVPRARAQVTVS